MARILHIVDTIDAWRSGIWYHRTEVPMKGLSSRGHTTRTVVIGNPFPDEMMEFPTSVIMGRIYPEAYKPIDLMKRFKKQGTRVIWDLDDDYWAVDPTNPSRFVSNVFKDQYEGLIAEADAITTPSPVLAKKIKKLHPKKKIYIVPNAIDFDDYKERPHENKPLTIGYMGAASHWKDLQLIIPVINALHEKYDFNFKIYGMTGEPLEAVIYYASMFLQQGTRPEVEEYNKEVVAVGDMLNKFGVEHIPFYPPVLHPTILSKVDFDIGLAPLEDNEFNRGKSNIKFYEYAAVGTCTLASDVEPYKQEVTYRAKNTFKDWYEKLEKLIVDEKFRNDLTIEQQKWVKENRDIKVVAIDWEVAAQREGGGKVLNQDKSLLKNIKNMFVKKDG
jgi:glycosyltransferase involved in cell wall biosynthesis